MDVEIRRFEEEICWRDNKVDELEDEINHLNMEKYRLNPTKDGKLFKGLQEQNDRPVLAQGERDLKPEISRNMEGPILRQDQPIFSSQELLEVSKGLPHPDSVLGDERIIDVGQERSRPTVNPIGRSELHVATIPEQEERHEEEESDDTSGLDHDSLVIGDPPPPLVNEGLYGIARFVKRHYKRRPTIGIKMVELHPRWICGAHQKQVLITWLMQKCRGCKKG
ncbi:hypothetical protein RHMOL_Rhmol11G0112700 [Rhododendron molle]|uniref:Uncharacterized protein n=1 Tax=Rhododendron molle TaxID=49168 RepID=A0ACC0LRF6_RHOML|nr:hypothetical protein RHMOL_Rhmol11G0112700 [Rhododendron molle]